MSNRSSIYDEVNTPEMPNVANGQATVVTPGSVEMKREEISGYTNPNLHRRVTTPSTDESGQVVDYSLYVNSNNSYRLTESHSVESDERDEAP